MTPRACRASRRLRLLGCAGAAAVVASTVAGCGGSDAPSASTAPVTTAAARLSADAPVRRPRAVRLRLVGSATLPAPVQLPGLAAVGGRVLAVGGLDSADTSTAACAGAPARAAAARCRPPPTTSARPGRRPVYLFGGGTAAGR